MPFCICLVFFNRSTNIFLISPGNVCCGYSLEAPHQGASNKYLLHMFSWRNKKKYHMATPFVWSCVYLHFELLSAS